MTGVQTCALPISYTVPIQLEDKIFLKQKIKKETNKISANPASKEQAEKKEIKGEDIK